MSFAEQLGESAEERTKRWYLNHPNQDLVRHFHHMMGFTVSNVPTVTDRTTREVRDRILWEEFKELGHELVGRARPDLTAIAHEAADCLYLLYGLAVECGFDLDACFREVHLANMTKTAPPDPTQKAIKGEGFVKADVSGVL